MVRVPGKPATVTVTGLCRAGVPTGPGVPTTPGAPRTAPPVPPERDSAAAPGAAVRATPETRVAAAARARDLRC